MRTIGEIIRTERRKAMLTQQELADLSGVERVNICKWETNTTNPLFEGILKVSIALGVNLMQVCMEEYEHEIFNPVPAHKGRKVAMVKRIRP